MHNDMRYIELLLGEIAAKAGGRKKKHWMDSVVNAIGFIIVFGFLALMVLGEFIK